MAKRSIKKEMRRMGVDNAKDFNRVKLAAMAGGGVKMIEGDDQAREEKCLAEIQRICASFDCVMLPEVTIGAGRIEARVRIQAKPRGQEGVSGSAILS